MGMARTQYNGESDGLQSSTDINSCAGKSISHVHHRNAPISGGIRLASVKSPNACAVRGPHVVDVENGTQPSPQVPNAVPASDLGPEKATPSPASTSHEAWKLVFGAGGIYLAYLYYGTLQEDVFRFESDDGSKFTSAWYLQFLEAMANVVVGIIGRRIVGGTPDLPLRPFIISGCTQVCSKAFTALSLANGLAFPVAILAKSGKMAPVMAGQLVLGGANYRIREYLQVVAVVGGTALLSRTKNHSNSESTSSRLGLAFVTLSLVMDGVTAGFQKRLKNMEKKPKPYDYMLYTNLTMMVVALMVSMVTGDFQNGWMFCVRHPRVMELVVHFSLCSAIGQSFIFYTVAHFDPLVCTTITTTRKIFSVFLSIVLKGHVVSQQGWVGIGIAIGGLLAEIQGHVAQNRRHVKSKVSM